MRTSPISLADLDPADALAAIRVNARAATGTVHDPYGERLAATVELYAAHDPIPDFTPTVVVPRDYVIRVASTVYGRRTRMQRLLARVRDTSARRVG